MGFFETVIGFVAPKATTYYILQPGKTYWVRDSGIPIPIRGMENELKIEENIIRLKKSKMIIPRFQAKPIKTALGMKDVCFAYMPDYRNIYPLRVGFNDEKFKIEPEDYNLQYLRGTIRTYQDIQFKDESFWQKYFLPIMFIVGMVTLGVFMRMSLDRMQGIAESFARIEGHVDRVAGNIQNIEPPALPPAK